MKCCREKTQPVTGGGKIRYEQIVNCMGTV
jgi:hypothetical protein